jgi:monoamine oxidase
MDFGGDVLGYWGRNIIEDYDGVLLKKLPGLSRVGRQQTPQLPLSKVGFRKTDHPVGILGAGVGGLYTALILDSLDIKYEILEASDHTGGRLFTYKFPDSKEYDYYDVGAMRFPLPQKDSDGNYKTGIMRRLGELINYPKLNDGQVPLKSTLIDYYYKSRAGGSFLYFNNERYQVSDTSHPPDFRAREMGVESEYVAVGVEKIVDDVVEPFSRMLINDLEKQVHKGWDVMKENDAYSLRAYMSFKYIPSVNLELPPMHLTNNVINWCETFDNSTGSYDRGLTETVLESLAFAKSGSEIIGDVEWKCFKGGSHVLIDYMTDYITANRTNDLIKFNKSVTSISQGGEDTMEVSVRGESSRTYSHVISTIPLPGLRTIDLSGAGLNVMQKNALRKLQYGPSIKVGVRFQSAWWTDRFGIVGGQSFTDLPIRTIVYPSYGVDSGTPSTVLIASYCWTNDAERLGALISTGKTEYIEQLKELVLRNLAEVHNVTYSFLLSEYSDIHAWDWNYDPLTMGAFAYFGPGDFQDLYTALSVPNANKRFHFAGEAISTRHAWVVGALDSAWRAVYEYLLASGQPQTTIEKFFDLWGKNIEWVCPSSWYIDEGQRTADPNTNTLLRVHMACIYAGETSGEVKF